MTSCEFIHFFDTPSGVTLCIFGGLIACILCLAMIGFEMKRDPRGK